MRYGAEKIANGTRKAMAAIVFDLCDVIYQKTGINENKKHNRQASSRNRRDLGLRH
jgi:hypothetical protein